MSILQIGRWIGIDNAPPRSLWMIPYRRNPFFTGRENMLAHLYQRLTTANANALIRPQAISGLGGIGKTQLVVEYAYRYQHAYEYILWVKADSYESILSDFIALSRLLQLIDPEEYDPLLVIQVVKRWLFNHTGWLLIFDNVDDLTIVRDFLPVDGKGHVLLTTCSSITGTIAQRIELGRMDDKEAALFLLYRSKILDLLEPLASAQPEDLSLALELVQMMVGLPLALDQAGAYIEETGCSLADYLQLFQTRQALLLKQRGLLVTDHPDAATTTWSLSFEKVLQKNPVSADIMGP